MRTAEPTTAFEAPVAHDSIGLEISAGQHLVRLTIPIGFARGIIDSVAVGGHPSSETMRLAHAMAQELKDTDVTSVALTPGFLRSEAMLDHFGVTEDNWRDAAKTDPHFIASETPAYIGRALVALACDPNVKRKSGQALATGPLALEYGFRDADGSQPNWSAYYQAFKASQVS